MQIKDTFGIKPIAKAIDTTVTKSFEGIEGFLKLVCAPALEEIGLMARDQIRSWRLKNILNIIEKAKGKIEFRDDKLDISVDARISLSIIENGSLFDNPEMQELWAGLFASSCTSTSQDDENLMFIDILKQITKVQATIIKYACENSRKVQYKNTLLVGDRIEIGFKELTELTNVTDVHRLDRELDHLRSLELITPLDGGFVADDETLTAVLTPTALALSFFMRCQGYNGSPNDYWKDSIITEDDIKVNLQGNGFFIKTK